MSRRLVRPKENTRIIMNKKGNKIKAIKRKDLNIEFNELIHNISSQTMFSIIILDVSGSMAGDYSELIDMTNKIIKNQMLN